MYLNCYERPKKVIAERMLGRAFDEFRKGSEGTTRFEAEDLALLTDQQIIELMLAHSGPSSLTCRMIRRLMKGVTFEVLYNAPIPIKITGPDGLDEGGNALDKLPTEIRRWAEAVLKEDYGGAYLQIPTDWAKTLSRRSEVDESQIIVTVPPWSIVDNWLKEGQIRILLEDSGSFSVDHVDKISNVLKDFTPALARARLTLRIFVDPDLTAQQKEKLLVEAKNLFTATQASS
jgi:hypothetical protein